jgi:hypothetical protein
LVEFSFVLLILTSLKRVTGSSKAYFLLQRAQRIVGLEHELPKAYRVQHLKRLKLKYQTSKSITTGKEKDRPNNATLEMIEQFKEQIDKLFENVADISESMVNII